MKLSHVSSFLIILCLLSLSSCPEKKNADIPEEHKSITGKYNKPQQVTVLCLKCHSNAGDEVIKTHHWRWEGDRIQRRGHKKIIAGKKNLLNNFCIALTSNWPRCTSCHAGYGWKDSNFDFSKKENIDCLVCHDTTGTYKKHPTKAGYPAEKKSIVNGEEYLPPDYLKIARNAGKTSRRNCGTCHFFGGGGDSVKHGNLDSSLVDPDHDTDVHMGGKDFTCTRCHNAEKHIIPGTLHGSETAGADSFGCCKCHRPPVHENDDVERHLAHVACQACHIPEYAVNKPTKIYWDWSTAGKDLPAEKNKYGIPTYNKKKGSSRWIKNSIPEYLWFNGNQNMHVLGDRVKDPDNMLVLNKQNGSIADPDSRIMPFKVMKGRQGYDKKFGFILIPKLFGKGGFWKTFNWDSAFREGMKAAGLKYSGKYGWIETAMLWPINHMVKPEEKALGCNDCHGSRGRIDWKKLGYAGDPGKTGGRFKNSEKKN